MLVPHNRAATSTEAIEGHGHPSVAVAREVVNEKAIIANTEIGTYMKTWLCQST